MICKHFLPQDATIRTAREGQLNSFILDEVSICSFIRLFRDLGFFSASKLDANVVLAIDRFMKAHNNWTVVTYITVTVFNPASLRLSFCLTHMLKMNQV